RGALSLPPATGGAGGMGFRRMGPPRATRQPALPAPMGYGLRLPARAGRALDHESRQRLQPGVAQVAQPARRGGGRHGDVLLRRRASMAARRRLSFPMPRGRSRRPTGAVRTTAAGARRMKRESPATPDVHLINPMTDVGGSELHTIDMHRL